VRERELHESQRCECAGLEGVHDLCVGDVEQRGDDLDLRVVHHDVEATEVLDDGVDARRDLRALADVAHHRQSPSAARLDLGRCRVELRRRTRRDRDGRTVGRERVRDPQTEALTAAGDDRDLAVELCHGASLSRRNIP
jgi:hypothetical protein